jgi:phosphoesterase RecJ-like protein
MRRFVIELDASKTKVDQLTYETKNDKLLIHLAPKHGSWEEKDLNFTSSGYRYDLVICLGATDLESCAHLYHDHPDFFYHTPIINIDHAPENEHFGQLNVVDLTAVALGEVCHDLIEAIEPELIDEETATAFLAGMIAKTKSFKTRQVTPKTLQTASKLVARGARRETIVHHLYRTRSVPTLRLWGRALARLKSDPSSQTVWTLLSLQDFLHAGAEEGDLPDVIDELIASSPEAKLVVLIHETRQGGVTALVRAERPLDALALFAPLKPVGSREEVRLRFPDQTVIQAEQAVLEALKSKPTR